MVIVSPSLLACDFLNLAAQLRALEVVEDLWLHLDIMDGHFVPNLTFGHPVIQKIAQATKLKLDAHLMVNNPEFYVETFKKFSLHNITFHWEATANAVALVQKAKQFYPSVGISLRPATPISVLPPDLLGIIDLLLVMSVEPGFGGQSFIPSTYQKLQQLKSLQAQHGYQFIIQVDGGVNANNCHQLIQHGVNNLVAGNFIFQHTPEEYAQTIFQLGHGS